MKLHENQTEFRELITLTAREKHISESAVERDYYIVHALKQLADSEESDSWFSRVVHHSVSVIPDLSNGFPRTLT